jgi:hypothetical protein
MKTHKLKLALILMLCVNLLSSLTVSSQNRGKSSSRIKSIALVSTMIGKITQVPIPVMDAPPFIKKTNSIAPLIINEEEQSVDRIREVLGEGLKKRFNCAVYYGNTLTTEPEYQEVIKKYNFPDNLKIDDKNFPNIIIPADEKNLFKFDNTKDYYQIEKFLKNKDNTQNTASEICNLLGTDLVVVSYSSIEVVRYRTFGGYADVSLYSYIFIYDKEGKLLGENVSHGKPVKIVGDELTEYKTILDTLPNFIDQLIEWATRKL